MKITVKLLKQHNACSDQVELFRKLFPEGTEVTLAALKKAAKGDLELSWFAQKFLSVGGFAAYLAARTPAYAAYRAALAQAWEAKTLAQAYAAYEAAIAPVNAAYKADTAQALWKAWKKEFE